MATRTEDSTPRTRRGRAGAVAAVLLLLAAAMAAGFLLVTQLQDGRGPEPESMGPTMDEAIENFVSDPVAQKALQVGGAQLESTESTRVGAESGRTITATLVRGDQGVQRILFTMLLPVSGGWHVEETHSVCLDPEQDPALLLTVPFPTIQPVVFEIGRDNPGVVVVEGTSFEVVERDGSFAALDREIAEPIEATSQVFRVAGDEYVPDERESCSAAGRDRANDDETASEEAHDHEHETGAHDHP